MCVAGYAAFPMAIAPLGLDHHRAAPILRAACPSVSVLVVGCRLHVLGAAVRPFDIETGAAGALVLA
jgi:hypothetical protein